MKKQLGTQWSVKTVKSMTTASFIFLASGLVACSSEQPKPQNPPAQNQAKPIQPGQPGEQPGQVPQNQAQAGQPGQQGQQQGEQPGMAAEIPPPPPQLGVVSEVPSVSHIPTEKTVVRRQSIPTVTETRVGADINRMNADDFKAMGTTGDLAQSIVQYRNAHGPFKSVKDLNKVPQMDDQWLADTQDQLAVSQTPPTG